MFFNYVQINAGKENALLHTDDEVVYHIQALQPDSDTFNAYIVVSFLLLFFISILNIFKRQKSVIPHVIPFLSSEQEAFKTFSKREKEFALNNFLAFSFFVVQISFLSLSFLDANEFIQVKRVSEPLKGLIVVVLMMVVIFVKYIISSQLNHLIKPNFEVKYYQFTYYYPLFLLALLLFITILMDANFKIDYSEIIYIIIFCLFYVWLIIRWVFISVRYQTMKSLYFFLYLCALEVAPLLLVIELLQ